MSTLQSDKRDKQTNAIPTTLKKGVSAGAVAKPGIAVKIGAKKIASRNNNPVTMDARPVLAPAPTPAC